MHTPHSKRTQRFGAIILGACLIAPLAGCTPPGADDPDRFDQMEQADLTIGDEKFAAWIAKTDNERALGFMEVEAKRLETLPDGRYPGMLFIFKSDNSTRQGFWMRRVPVPLDIAFVNSDRTIVTIKTMAPYDERNTYSDAPYRYALEVRAGLFKELGVEEGNVLEFPDSVLNNVQ
ncbi:MAG: DUF192 domain-containing protein [Phycisphaerae bacterium]|nr:DUF192 domain-containing protein [Phycisphaerales bacterium]